MMLTESQILRGKALDHLSTIPDESIRLVLTDPPYNASKRNNFSTMGRKGIDFGEWDKDFDQLSWLDEAARIIMPGGSIVIWNNWKNLGAIASRLEELGFDIKDYLTYLKQNPWPRNWERRFVQSTEHAFWAVKRSRKHKWVFNPRPNPSRYDNGIFEYPVQKDAHPNKKPNGMFRSLIEILSNEGDWVVDPYCGSGTTCYAAELTNRNFIAIENDPEYYKQALDLWHEAKSLHA